MGLLDSAADTATQSSTNSGISSTASAAISGGSGLIGGLIGAFQTGAINHQNFRHEVDMYNLQRQNALTDRDFQNQYNSPAAQMQRLKQAGLNPNLVYGNGNAIQPSAPTRAASPSMGQMQVPNTGSAIAQAGQSAIQAYNDTSVKQAETNLLQAQLLTAYKEQAFKESQTKYMDTLIPKVQADTALTKQNTQFGAQLFPANLEHATLANAKLSADTSFTVNQQFLNTLTATNSYAQGVQRIMQMKADTALTQQQAENAKAQYDILVNTGVLQKLDIDLKNKGFTWSDPVWARQGKQMLEQILPTVGEMNKVHDDPKLQIPFQDQVRKTMLRPFGVQ